MLNSNASGQYSDAYAHYYVVRRGDTLRKIAMRFYGDEALSRSIFIANRNVLSDPCHLEPGQKLLLP